MQQTHWLTPALLALSICGANAATPQQEKMKTCNAEATGKSLKGADRKAFMKDCLSAEQPATGGAEKMTPQQEKMKFCNAEATSKSLTGAARKQFLSGCLKKTATTPTGTPVAPAPVPTPQTAPPSPQ